MHSAIEGSKKSKAKLFSINDWEKVILKARRKDKNERLHPYHSIMLWSITISMISRS